MSKLEEVLNSECVLPINDGNIEKADAIASDALANGNMTAYALIESIDDAIEAGDPSHLLRLVGVTKTASVFKRLDTDMKPAEQMTIAMGMLTCSKKAEAGADIEAVQADWAKWKKKARIEQQKASLRMQLADMRKNAPDAFKKLADDYILVMSDKLSIPEFIERSKGAIDIDMDKLDAFHEVLVLEYSIYKAHEEEEEERRAAISYYHKDEEESVTGENDTEDATNQEEEQLLNYAAAAKIAYDYGYDPVWSAECWAIEINTGETIEYIESINQGEPDEQKWRKSEVIAFLDELEQ